MSAGPSYTDLRDLLERAFNIVVKPVADAHVDHGETYWKLRDDIHVALREPQPASITAWGVDGSAFIRVVNDVHRERIAQDAKYGGPSHDDGHSTDDFLDHIFEKASLARSASLDDARARLVQVAALAVAAIESLDRRQLRAALEKAKGLS